MTFPIQSGKHRLAPLVTPQAFFDYLRREGRPLPRDVPESVILLFGSRHRSHVLRQLHGKPVRELPHMIVLPGRPRGVGTYFVPGIGGPHLAAEVEELAELGVRRFVIVGLAGSLQPSLGPGSLVLCTKALRDEGTSHHYARATRYAHPQRALTATLRQTLQEQSVPYRAGPSWTIDAVYRETREELRRYRDDGVLTVEMEAATLFAVARYRRVAAAAVFVVSDVLSEERWSPHFTDTRHHLRQALAVVISALAASSGASSAPR